MTLSEFSDQFDVLYNNISSNQAPGLDEYEKSVFLTKAQYQILKEYFDPTGNAQQQGFDGSPKRQIDFSALVRSQILSPLKMTNNPYPSLNVYQVTLGDDYDKQIMFFISEMVSIKNNLDQEKLLQVIPITNEKLQLNLTKPFGSQPLKRQAWRLLQVRDRLNTIATINSSSDTDIFRQQLYLILHNGDVPKDYIVKYVKRPQPIILTDLKDTGVSLEGKTGPSNCELDPEIHSEILERAVTLAKLAYAGGTATTAAAAQQANNR